MLRAVTEGSVELTPLTLLEEHQIDELIPQLHSLANEVETAEQLRARHLLGVIKRHRTLATTEAAVRKARAMMIDERNQRIYRPTDRLGVYAVRVNAELAGMATHIPDQPLREPRGTVVSHLPAGVTRRSSLFSRYVDLAGQNVTAWLAAKYGEEPSTDTYKALCGIAGNLAWTIEPVDAVESTAAIEAAGLNPLHSAARYDDNEAGGRPPLSQFFMYRDARLV